MILSNQSHLSLPPSETEGKHWIMQQGNPLHQWCNFRSFHISRQFRWIPPPAIKLRNRFWIITGEKSICQIRTLDFLEVFANPIFFLVFTNACKRSHFIELLSCAWRHIYSAHLKSSLTMISAIQALPAQSLSCVISGSGLDINRGISFDR